MSDGSGYDRGCPRHRSLIPNESEYFYELASKVIDGIISEEDAKKEALEQ